CPRKRKPARSTTSNGPGSWWCMPRPRETSVKRRGVSASPETPSIARSGKRSQGAMPTRPDRIALRVSKPLGAAAPGRPGGWIVIVRFLGDQRLRRQNQTGHRGRIANRAVANLDRIDNAGFGEIDGCTVASVEPVAVLAFGNLRNLR